MTKKTITFLISYSLLSALRFPGPAWADGVLTVDNLIVTTNATIYGELNIGYPSSTNGAVEATGGDITMDGNYRIHTFSASGTFVVNGGASLTCDVLVVAGGGGGAAGNDGIAGGAGAGGMIYTNGVIVSGLNSVTVGEGGAGGYFAPGFAVGKNGSNSAFATLTTIGGGHGSKFGSYEEQAGNGGSGGGACLNFPTPGAGTLEQGYDGGLSYNGGPSYEAGGGGGAASVGSNGISGAAGDGGSGRECPISGSVKYYAGGGGAGVWSGGSSVPGNGGLGGGGNGAKNTNGTNGAPNTGGGGGSTGWADGSCLGGNGGSGIVIVRYLVSSNVSPSNVPSDIVTITSDGINQTRASATNVFLGKVGIGTDLPAEQLHVGGNVQVDGSLSLGGDPRSNWPSGAEGALMVSNNLSEISGEANKEAARANLGLGSAATNEASVFLSPTSDGSQLTGITAEQVGAVSTNAGALLAANNLAELAATAATARDNLGALSTTGNGSQLTGITAGQVGALSTTGGVVNGASFFIIPAGDVSMGVYTNR